MLCKLNREIRKTCTNEICKTRYILCIGIGRGRIGRQRSSHQSASQREQSERARPIGQTLNQTPSHRDHPACPDQRTRKKKITATRPPVCFSRLTRASSRRSQCMSWCVASIPLLIWIAGLGSVLRGQVHWCTDAGKSRNRLTLSHFVSREKRLPSRQTRSASRSLIMISNPDPAFSANQ